MKLFGFGRKTLKDYSLVATDMHSHLIPGIDDGSESLEMSIELIRAMYVLGYRKLFTTPHINSNSYNNTAEDILHGLKTLRASLTNAGIPVEIDAAAEYHTDEFFRKRIKNEKLLTFGKNYLLLEIPFINEPEDFFQIVFDLQSSGYKIVLAHTERYTYWHGNKEKYESLIDRNIFLQINISSLTGYYSIPVKKVAEWLIDKEYVSFLGSDLHNNTYLDEIKKALKEKSLFKLVNSGKLLNSKL
ncbi:MAG: hypothetical protein KA792_08115 [Bacteroidales bacterium]|nr:hypothetical protein [Bacteroidales bacterium]